MAFAMDLTIRQLATFREVMRSGSISQAARAVGRTQPAVSAMIAAIEAELGFPLFLREKGKLTPTPEARFFLEEAEAVLERLDRAKRTLTKMRALEAGVLRIACHPAAADVFVPSLLTAFLEDKAEVDLALVMRSSDVIEELVASQQFDVGFAESSAPRASIEQQRFDLECVCILREDDPLAGRAVITPDDLDGAPMAALFDEHPTASETRAAFAAAGRTFVRRLELRTFLPGLPFVARGRCRMIADMITAHSHVVRSNAPQGLAIRAFRPRVGHSVSILTPAYVGRAMLARAFAGHLAEAIETMREEVEAASKAVLRPEAPSEARDERDRTRREACSDR